MLQFFNKKPSFDEGFFIVILIILFRIQCFIDAVLHIH